MNMQVRAIRDNVRRDGFLSGTVTHVNGEQWTVMLADGSELTARKAVSCWVQPVPHDLVLVSGSEHAEDHYVLAVLERTEPAPLDIVAHSGLRISAPSGSVTVEADQLTITARGDASVTASMLQLGATDMRIVFQELAAWGQEIVTRVDGLRMIARHASVVMERIHSRVRRSYKVVSEIEHTSAKQLSYRVVDTLSLHSKNSVITAEELIKLDGKLMQLG
jgi:hypothetical protein